MSATTPPLQIVVDGTAAARRRLAALEARRHGGGDVEREVVSILRAVKRDGDRALLRYTARFDGVKITARDLVVRERELVAAERTVTRKNTDERTMSMATGKR